MTSLSQHDTDSLLKEVFSLSRNCELRRTGMNQGTSAQQKIQNFEYYQKLANSCQEFLVGVQSKFPAAKDFFDWCDGECPVSIIAEVTQNIIPFAMTHESCHLTALGRWLSHTLKAANESEDRRYSPLEKTKDLFGLLCRQLGDLEGEKYREPAFYVQGEFRDGFLHGSLYSRKVSHAIVNIMDDSVDNPEAARVWIKQIHDTCMQWPETGKVIKDTLRDRLMDEPVAGLDDLRDYVLGQVLPTGVECSKRLRHLVERIFSTRRELDLEPDVSALLLNKRYMSEALIEDLIGRLEKAAKDAEDAYENHGATPESPNLRNLTNFYKMAGLGVDHLCKIAMVITGRISRGEIIDYEEKPPAVCMKAVMAQSRADSSNKYDPRWPEQAVMGSILMSLPQEIVAEVAQDNDFNRTTIYTLTGNSVHLSNMQDGKRLDKIMGSDLGL